MADKLETRNSKLEIRKFNVRISGELSADSLKDAYGAIADHFSQLALGMQEVPPLTDGICRVTPVEGG